MNVDQAKAAVLRILEERRRITNSEILDLCGGDARLRGRVREELIIDDLAKDKEGAGLVLAREETLAPPEPSTAVEAPGVEAVKDIFLSYSHDDWRDAEEVVRRLEDVGLRVWIDRKKIGAAEWAAKISMAIDTSTVFAILCSEHSLASDDVKNECALANHFKRHRAPLHIRRPPLPYPRGFDYFLQAWNAIVVAGRHPQEWLDEVITGLEEDPDDTVQSLGRRARAALASMVTAARPTPPPAPPARRPQVPAGPDGRPPWRRVFRVYISGTFADLAAERNALQERVFPRLRELAMAHGARFEPVDLRWGVSEQDLLDQRVMRIVHDEISRCRRESPYLHFISLIGERLGWRPLPEEIAARDFEAILAAVPAPDERDLLETWYRRDDNAAPPAYELVPRMDAMAKWEEWAPVEAKLRAILRSALESADLDLRSRRAYQASVLEQEVARGLLEEAPGPHDPAFCFMRAIEGLPRDGRALPFVDLADDGTVDEEAVLRLAQLKNEIRGRLAQNVFEYRAAWDPGENQPTDDHLDSLCEDAYEALSRVMLDALQREAEVDPLDREVQEQRAFAADRSRVAVGNEALLARVEDHLRAGPGRPLVLVGKMGTGVSTAMAAASTRAREFSPAVVARFIAATPASTDGTALLDGICREIARLRGLDEGAIPAGYPGLAGYLQEALAASSGEPLLVFVDGLDMLGGPARDLRWVPPALAPANALVVSVEPGPLHDVLQRLLPPESFLEVEGVSLQDAERLLDAWLERANRTLQPHQREAVLRGFAASESALYLRLAAEEATRWRSFSPPDETAALGTSVPEILRAVFRRLADDHGPVLVSRTLAFLAAGRYGLSEDELLVLLSQDPDTLQEQRSLGPHAPRTDRLPLAVWIRLRRGLEPYLAERVVEGTVLLGFLHRSVAEVVVDDHLWGDDAAAQHEALARYFRGVADPAGNRSWTGDARALAELPYHLALAGAWTELFEVLTDFTFLERKAATVGLVDVPHGDGVTRRYLGIDAIAEDVDLSLQRMPEGDETGVLRSLLEAVRRESHLLRRWPSLLWQQLSNRLASERVAGAAELVAAEANRRLDRGPWLQTRWPAQPALLLTLAGHQGPVRACVVSADGSRIVSAGNDSTVKLWDPATGQDRATLTGHEGWVTGCALDASGELLLTASEDRTARLWDLGPARRRDATLAGHEDDLTACAISPDGRVAVSASRDGTLRVWDPEQRLELATIPAHEGGVTDCDIRADGTVIVSSGADGSIRLWDARSGEEVRAFPLPHGDDVPRSSPSPVTESSCAISADGRLIVSGHEDGTVRLWDAAAGTLVHTLDGHDGPVSDCTVNADGTLVVTASADRTIRLWETASGLPAGTLSDLGGPVDSCAISADGRLVVSGARDGSLKAWDAARIREEAYRPRHAGTVLDCAFNTDGSLVLTAGDDGTVRISERDPVRERMTFRGDRGAVLSCVPTGDSLVLTGNGDGMIAVWDPVLGMERAALVAHEGGVFGLDTKGSFLASCGDDGTIRLWQVGADGSLDPVWRRGGGAGPMNACAVALDGTCVAASDDGTLQVWSPDGQPGPRLLGHRSSVTSCAISPDASVLVSTSWDGTARVWDARSGDELARFEEHGDRVWGCDLSPDARLAATAGGDGTLRVWDPEGREIGILPLPAEPRAVAFHPNRPVIACGDSGGNIHVVAVAGLEESRVGS